MSHIVAVTSYPGAGKSVFAAIAQELGYDCVEMGEIVRDHANKQWADRVRRASQAKTAETVSDVYGEFVTNQRAEHGAGVVADWCESAVTSSGDHVLVDGMRSPEERQQFETYATVTVVYIHTPASLRLTRVQQRGREGEDSFGAAELLRRDTRENRFGLNHVIANADYTIHNTVGIDTFNRNSRDLLENLHE